MGAWAVPARPKGVHGAVFDVARPLTAFGEALSGGES